MITPELLQELEQKYGGETTAPMRKQSPLDPRLRTIGQSPIVGGDRMKVEDYRVMYANHLPENPKVLIELGIFKGTGLAIWCDIFPNTKIIGLDIDLSYFDKDQWKKRGAFSKNEPSVYTFDKFRDGSPFYKIMAPIDVMIDDSAHDTESIVFAFENVLPFLAKDFVYFVEDNKEAEPVLREKFPSFSINRAGGIIVIKPD